MSMGKVEGKVFLDKLPDSTQRRQISKFLLPADSGRKKVSSPASPAPKSIFVKILEREITQILRSLTCATLNKIEIPKFMKGLEKSMTLSLIDDVIKVVDERI